MTDEAKFDRHWRSICHVSPCKVSELDDFIALHYLSKRPAIVLLAMQISKGDKPIGCIVYSAPPRQIETRYQGVTWELARLYLLDEIPRNAESWAISQSIKWIKKNQPDVQYLVSYADPSAGHSGCIYLAANWLPDGMTDDDRKTPRADYFDVRTGKKYGRRGNMPQDAIVERRPRVSKHRFKYIVRKTP